MKNSRVLQPKEQQVLQSVLLQGNVSVLSVGREIEDKKARERKRTEIDVKKTECIMAFSWATVQWKIKNGNEQIDDERCSFQANETCNCSMLT